MRTLIEEVAPAASWVGGSCVALAGAIWVIAHVNVFSFVWFVALAVAIASLPGVILAGVMALYIMVALIALYCAVLIAIGIVCILWEIVVYFWHHPI